MQNMHKTTHDGPLTGVHLPDHGSRGSRARVGLSTRAGGTHRGAGRGSKAVVYITAKGFGRVIGGSICPGAGFQQDYGDGPLQLNYVDTASRKGLEDGDSMMVMRSGRGHDDRMEVAENRAVAHQLVVIASVQGRRERLHTSGVEGRGA